MAKPGAGCWHSLILKWRLLPQFALALFLAASAAFVVSQANAVTAKEGKLRAAVIFGIMRFTSWPDTRAFNQLDKINLCLIGKPTSQDFLMPISGKRRLQGKEVEVKRVSKKGVNECQVVVIGGSLSKKSSKSVLSKADAGAMLSVCDGCREEFAEQSIINVTLLKQNVKFEVNLARANQAGVRLDAHLLELAQSVRKE